MTNFMDEVVSDLEKDLEREKKAHKKTRDIASQLRNEAYHRSERKVTLDHYTNKKLIKISKELGFDRGRTVAFILKHYLENEEF